VSAELDRILDDGYLAGLDERPTEEIRRMRADCEDHEEAVSYARRVLQGRLDLLRAELERRSRQGDGGASSLLELLPTILAWPTSDPGSARAVRLRVPERAAVLEAEIDRIVDEATLVDLSGHTPEDLASLLDRLAAHEEHLSGVRRKLFDRVDALRAELAARYKDGRAVVRDLIGGA